MSNEEIQSIRLVSVIVICALLTVFAFYLSYRTAQRSGSAIVFPAGNTYVGPTSFLLQ